MTKRNVVLSLVAMALLFGGCGGGGGKSDEDVKTTATTAAGTPTTKAGPELPAFASDFDRVCTTHVGFAGAASYEAGPGLHPMVFFEEYRGKSWVNTGTFPDGWVVKEDTNYKDNSELKAVQLIGCADRIKETPTGKKCEFENKGKKTTLELVDSTYELKVYAATTGKELQSTVIEAKDPDCPYLATFQEGDTTYVNEPSDDDYTNAVKPLVAP